MISLSYFDLKDLMEYSKKSYNNILDKKTRVKKWLYYHKTILKFRNNYINKDYIYYATFTFKNEKLNNNEIKKDSFLKYLRENGVKAYLLNKDFGEENQRLHFHGFIYTNQMMNNQTLNLYGYTKIVDISHIKEEEEEKVINYITNYVIKNNYFSKKMLISWIKGSIISL